MVFGLCCNGFLPGGKDVYIAAALIGFIGACGYYTYNQINTKICSVTAIPAVQTEGRFQTENACVPKEQIISGGVKKDAIPSLTRPKMVDAQAVDFLEADDRVIGLNIGGKSMAYPLRILSWHECVNDSVQDIHFAVIYCPLCDSVSVFNRRVKGKVLEFGISGKLYQSNVLLYDRQTDPQQQSLWSQMYGKAVSGPMVGTELETISYQLVTWETWNQLSSGSQVLSLQTGYSRNYTKDYYPQYFASPDLMFPVSHVDERFLLKDIVIGIRYKGKAKAYPIDHIHFEDHPLLDQIGGKNIQLIKHPRGDYSVHADEGVEVFHSFWFAWHTFHPDTEIYSGKGFNLDEWLMIKQSSL